MTETVRPRVTIEKVGEAHCVFMLAGDLLSDPVRVLLGASANSRAEATARAFRFVESLHLAVAGAALSGQTEPL